MSEPVKRWYANWGDSVSLVGEDDTEATEVAMETLFVLATDYDRDIKALELELAAVRKHDGPAWAAPYLVEIDQQAATIERGRAELTRQYDAYMDALKSEHDTLLSTGHAKTATGTTRAMMVIGEIHGAALTESAP